MYLCIYTSIFLTLYRYICLSLCPSVCLTINICTFLSIDPSIYSSCLSVCLSVCLSISLSIYLTFYHCISIFSWTFTCTFLLLHFGIIKHLDCVLLRLLIKLILILDVGPDFLKSCATYHAGMLGATQIVVLMCYLEVGSLQWYDCDQNEVDGE